MNRPELSFIPPRLEAKSNSKDEADLYIYGTIGGGFFTNGVTSDGVRHTLQDLNAKTLNVHIQSYGGDAFEGVAISNLLKNNAAKVHVFIDGIAASAASVIAMAGDTITMPKNTMLMIHRASMFSYGNKTDFEKSMNMLDKVDKALQCSYMDRFNGEEIELEKMLDDETWLTADDAKYYGLADEIVDPVKDDDDEEETNNDESSEEPSGGDPSSASAQSAEGFGLDMISRAIASATKNIRG